MTRNHLNLPSRWGHRVTQLKGGDLVVTGGSTKGSNATKIGVLSKFETEFYSSANVFKARSFHTSTALDSGEILVTGGWGANIKAELYDHTLVIRKVSLI